MKCSICANNYLETGKEYADMQCGECAEALEFQAANAPKTGDWQ